MITIFLLGILVLVVLYVISMYNKYVKLNTEKNNAFSDIAVFLQKRLDLIPNIVETVKGYAKHESETLTNVIEARNKMLKLDLSNINNVDKINEIQNQLSSTLKSLFALKEAYPDLKANTNFLNLQDKLDEIETQIERARRYYNSVASNLNQYIQVFPNVLFKGIFSFKEAQLFTANEKAHESVNVKF